jgi:hypothetical protein
LAFAFLTGFYSSTDLDKVLEGYLVRKRGQRCSTFSSFPWLTSHSISSFIRQKSCLYPKGIFMGFNFEQKFGMIFQPESLDNIVQFLYRLRFSKIWLQKHPFHIVIPFHFYMGPLDEGSRL